MLNALAQTPLFATTVSLNDFVNVYSHLLIVFVNTTLFNQFEKNASFGKTID